MTDIPKPDRFPRWASNLVLGTTTRVPNRVEAPESKQNVGWNEFEPPARQWFNDLQYYNYLWIQYFDDQVTNRNPVTDGNGAQIFNKENVLITLYAVDTVTPANYIHAVGFRGAGAPVLNVISNNVLGLDTPLADGTQAITGGTASDIIVYGQMQKQ